MIEINALFKTFPDRKRGAVHAVRDVSFRCASGQIYGLLGSNGAGKTTVLRILATLLRPTAGSGSVCGYNVVDEPELARRHIGFLAASTALYGRLTGRETLTYFARLYGIDSTVIGAIVRRAIDEFRLEEFVDVRVDKYSTGMKQRLSLARSVIHDPDVLILDEPTLGLDVLAARNVMAFVERQRDRGKVVLYSTHVMSEAERICDVIAIIEKGRIIAEGNMNLLRGRFAVTSLEDIFLSATTQAKEEI